MSSYSDSDYIEEARPPNTVELNVDNGLMWNTDHKKQYKEKIWLWFLDGTRKVLSVTAAVVFLIIFLISFYCVVIINFVFFVSSMLSYSLSPFYHGLCGNWAKFVFSIIQVIVACPYIQFYILFIISSVKQFIDYLPSFRVLIDYVWNLSIKLEDQEEGLNYEPWYSDISTHWHIECREKKYSILKHWLILAAFLLLSICIGFVWLCLNWNCLSILFGFLMYLVIIVQIFGMRVCWMWRYWFVVIQKGHAKRFKDTNRLTEWVSKIDTKFKTLKGDGRVLESQEVQTHNSYFARKYLDDVHLRSDSSDSDSSQRKEGEDEAAAEAQKQKARVEHQTKLNSLMDAIRGIFLAKYYKKIYELGVMIVEDPLHPVRKRVMTIIFTILNLMVIGFDIYRAAETPNGSFIFSIVFRFLCIPVASYFNVFTIYFYRLKKLMFNVVMIIGTIFTWLIIVVSIGAVIYSNVFLESERIDNLPLPTKQYEWNRDDMDGSVCTTAFHGIDLIDIVSLAFGAYDVARNQTVFNNQMVHFFGSDWTERISYDVKWINDQIPVVIYDLKDYDTKVFGFRGFASGSELAFQGKLFMIYKAIPFIQDIVVFYHYMVDWFIEFYIIRANNFGFHFFDPETIVNELMDPVIAICKEMNVDKTPNVIFAGVNCGGVLAKLAGMITHRQSVSFISFPVMNDFFVWEFDIDKDQSNLITNIYNYQGYFTEQEPALANNIGVPWIPTSAVRRDGVYQSFCTLATSCGSLKYEEYCRSVIGDDMDEVHRFFEK